MLVTSIFSPASKPRIIDVRPKPASSAQVQVSRERDEQRQHIQQLTMEKDRQQQDQEKAQQQRTIEMPNKRTDVLSLLQAMDRCDVARIIGCNTCFDETHVFQTGLRNSQTARSETQVT